MQRIGFIVFAGFNVMTCAVIAAFELANREMGEPVYDVRLRDRMRRAFLRAFGQPPQVIRRNARAEVRPELRAIARNANGPQFGGSPPGQQ
jgi:transcriptional regulator GlxA family with amidase domain